MLRLALVLSLLSSLALAQRNPDLEKAQQLLAARKYDAALKAIDAASRKGGLERESLLTLWESRGLAEASLGQTQKAEESFRSVLQLEPKRDLTGKYTGKVATVVAAAKEWFKANGGIELGPLDPGTADGRVTQVSFFVKNDPLKLITQVKFYLRIDGGAWKPVTAKVVNGAAATDTDALSIEWWAEALSERNDQLMFLGSAGRPIKQSAPPAIAKVEEPKKVEDAPAKTEPVKVTPTEKPEEKPVVAATSSGGSALRPVGYVLIGLGVAAVGVATYFGITANGLREGVKADLAAGNVSQSALFMRDQQAITNSTIANVLFISGGVLAVTGGTFWFLGRDVQVAPTVGAGGGGLTVFGKF